MPIHDKITYSSSCISPPRVHTNRKQVHSCPDSCRINQFCTSTHVLESWTELRSSWHFCSEPSSNTPARQMVHVHQSSPKIQGFQDSGKWLEVKALACCSQCQQLDKKNHLVQNVMKQFVVDIISKPHATIFTPTQQPRTKSLGLPIIQGELHVIT